MRALKSLADFKKLPGQRPKYLYKYRSLAPGNPRDFAEDIIRNNRLYHCLTEAFNDPFETVFYFEIPSAFSEYREYIYSWKRFSNLDDGDCEYLLSLKESGHPQGFSSFESELKRLLRQRTTVLSLCETYDNILMWSHYTDCHRGICIEFDLEVDKEYWGQVLPIQYRRRFPYIIKAEWSASEIVAIYLTKADFWAYEREWRFINQRKGPGLLAFPEDSISGVLLGTNISDEDMNTVLQWLNNRKRKPVLMKAAIDERTYSLRIDRIG